MGRRHPQDGRRAPAFGAARQTVAMTRRMTQTFTGSAQPEVTITFPGDHQHTGVYFSLLRAWAVDDETGDWWGMCNYYAGVGMQYLDWIHQDHLRPSGDVTDDGLIGGRDGTQGRH
jgi:hypothetical protein